MGRGDARGHPRRQRTRRRCDPRQGRLARCRLDLRPDPRAGGAVAARLAVAPRRPAARDRRAAAARADRRRLPPPRLREDVHGRHARLADGADARRLRRARSRAGRSWRRSSGLRPPPAGPSRCTRSATGRTGTRSTHSRRRRTPGSRSGSGTGSSTPSASIPRTCPGSPSSAIACSVQFSHAPSDRDLAERFWGDRLEGTYAFRSLLDSGAVVVNGSDAPGRGARPARRDPRRRPADDRRPPRVAAGRGADDRAGDRRLDRHAGLARGRRAPPRTAPARASSPISWCSRATRSPARPTSSSRSRSCRRWSAASGSTSRPPGIDACRFSSGTAQAV